MRTCLAFFVLGCCFTVEAHIGSPNVFLEDKAGEYPVRVVIRPPNVVPGLAEITVRVQEPVQRVTVLPVFWNAGREGSPAPDEAKLVRGETNLYSAELWLMKPGAYSVDVTIEGSRGKGTLAVPVNSMATNTRPMSLTQVIVLSALAAVLFLGGLTIARAIFRESRLDTGALPTGKDRWRGRAAMAVTALVLSLLVFGGKKWWDFEDRNYRNNALYKPLPVSAGVRTERDQLILTIKVDASDRRGRWTPLIPDHGKWMHLFLVRDGEPGAFAHLHPVNRGGEEFEAPLPPLPADRYHVYADVTHEDGFSETLIATAEIPPASRAMKGLWLGNSAEPICSTAVAQMLATNLFFPPDPDDSWQMDNGTAAPLTRRKDPSRDAARRVADAGGGYKIIWENPESTTKNLDASLRFKLLAPDNQPARIEAYMGMLGHAVVRRHDGAVFAHIHPVGTFSMAAQQFFVSGKPPKYSASQPQPDLLSPPAMEPHSSHTNRTGVAGEISFPYAFPEPGSYRFWVQMKSQDRILTGVFDTTVSATK
ncbi:MAG TPA: hypothetical protein VJW76_00245 [Verrucomicrobiae bacterium]|nr:hypothetical protein [Verrucomicrobiae bacterium]